MKDLKHYFANKRDKTEAKEVIRANGQIVANAANEVERIEDHSGKRCDESSGIETAKKSEGSVVEEKNEKPKVPFAPLDNNDESSIPVNETAKRPKSRKSTKMKKKNDVIASKTSKATEDSGDENDNSILSSDGKDSSARRALEEEANEPPTETTGDRREESNAFRVLMTRKTPVRYKTPPSTTEDSAAKSLEREKNEARREKLISLADKKGYSKRKIQEIEEAEKIERRLEKRAKVLTRAGKKQTDEKSSPLPTRTASPGDLRDYFCKITSEQRDREPNVLSRMEIRENGDIPGPEEIMESLGIKDSSELIEREKKMKPLTKPDDILESPEIGAVDSPAGQSRGKKRWTLRINLHCSDRDVDGDASEEPRVKPTLKKRTSARQKVKSHVENGITEEIHNSKKNKLSTNTKNLGKSDVESGETEREEQTLVEMDGGAEKSGTSLEIEIVEEKIANNKTEKLAPLFVKRPKPDAAVMEARRAFLQYVPTENDGTSEKNTVFCGFPMLPFPTISHVTQFHNTAENHEYEPFFPMRQSSNYVPNHDLNAFKSLLNLANQRSVKDSKKSNMIEKANVEEVLVELESRCTDARKIWTSVASRSKVAEKKSPKRRGKRRKSVEKKKSLESEDREDAAWTDKYRPRSTCDIVGNEQAAETLRKWLCGWTTRPKKSDSSGDEFEASDCSNSQFEGNQVAVLLGPHGSGKTASVYAVAEELGYSIIEVNASSKRTGKRILKELEEATQSHLIKKQNFALLKTPTSDKETNAPKKSLILMEDIDVIFEEDEGFISATCQLTTNTRRPIVMTGRDTCSYFSKMAPQQLRIHYENPVNSRVSALLELITVAESGCRLPRPCLDKLLRGGDLRKALLQLQYLLSSGKPSANQVATNSHDYLWQDMRQFVYKPAIRSAKSSAKKKTPKSEKSRSKKETSDLESLANNLENLSLLSRLVEINDPAIEIFPLKLEASLSLDERDDCYSSIRETSTEIADWVRGRVMHDSIRNETVGGDFKYFRKLALKKELNVGVNGALARITLKNLDAYAKLDYLSTSRAICRAEELRTATCQKRTNRFYHYLRNFHFSQATLKPNILTAACKMMQEKNAES